MGTIIIFLFSLLILVIAAETFIRAAEKLGTSLHLSPLIIGATIVALGTSLPEAAVTTVSLARSEISLSVGSIVGSNIGNVLFIFGLGILLFPIRIGTIKTQRNNLINIIITFIFTASFFLSPTIQRVIPFILIIGYLIFLITEIIWGETGRSREDRVILARLKIHENPFVQIITILIATVLLFFSSKAVVSFSVSIAHLLGVSTGVIGLTAVALGTSLPELASTLIAGHQKDWKLAIGDIQGSNIFNLAILGSLTLKVGRGTALSHHFLSLSFLIISTLLFSFLVRKYRGKSIPKIYGVLMILTYLAYLTLILQPSIS